MSKKFITSAGLLLVTALIFTFCVSLAADQTPESKPFGTKHPGLTEQQKLEIESRKAEIEATKKKLEALTNEQKAELTDIQNQILTLQKQLVKKYVEFGVLTQEKGDKIISRMEKAIQEGRNSWFPGPCGPKRKEKHEKETSSATGNAACKRWAE